jgi:hypothetical protein
MKRKNSDFEDLLPIELKLRLLEAELGRLDSDLSWLQQRREEISKEIQYYEKLLVKNRSRNVLRRVK